MNELEDHLAQVLWKSDDDAPERSWGFVTMRRRGKYRHQARAVIEELALSEERVITQSLDDCGINVVGDGPIARVDCHMCEQSFGHGTPREAFDVAYLHARHAHGMKLAHKYRYVTEWRYVGGLDD